MIVDRTRALAAVGSLSIVLVTAACGGGSDEPQPGQIGRIDGPATVDEDKAGADQEGAPASVTPDGRAITDGS